MDFALLIPIIALATGFVVVLKMPRQAFMPKGRRDGEVGEQVRELEEEVGRLRRDLAAAEERLEFTERLLTGRKEDDPTLAGESPDRPPAP